MESDYSKMGSFTYPSSHGESQEQESKIMKSIQLERWSLIQAIGSGSTSDVFLAIDPDKEEIAAAKLIRELDSPTYELITNEAATHKSLKHPNIIAFKEFYENLEFQATESHKLRFSAILLEYAEAGEFFELLQTLGALPEALARTYFLQLLQAVEYMHGQGIVHRDIKSENLLLDRNYCLKLSDFSHSCRVSSSVKLLTKAGTSKYFAPEIHKDLPYEGQLADIFSAGIILFVMVVGHLPFFEARVSDELYSLIIEENFDKFWSCHDSNCDLLSQPFKKLMQEIFASNPSKRATIVQIMKDPWMNDKVLAAEEVVSLVEKLVYCKK